MMTPSQKIETHATLDDLFATIETDKGSRDILARRYPVRFILLDDFCVFQEFANRVSAAEIILVDLEKLIETDDRDRWISQDEVLEVLRHGEITVHSSGVDAHENLDRGTAASRLGQSVGKSPHSIMVSPVSEIIRFYDRDKFRAFLHAAALMESSGFERIYIPLIGLRQRFEDFLAHFERITESAPVWAVGTGNMPGSMESGSQSVRVFLLPDAGDTNAFESPEGFDCPKSFYEWLRFWKTRAPTERMLFSSCVLNAFYENAQPDNIFQITKIKNVHDFLKEVLGVLLPFEYKLDEDDHWQRLLLENDWAKRKNFQQFVAGLFNSQRLSAEMFIDNWLKPQTDDFGRWLLKNAALETLQTSNPYLCAVLTRNVDLHHGGSLLGKIALGISRGEFDEAVLRERRQLLEKFPANIPLSEADKTALMELIDKTAETEFDTALSLCTGRFCFECERLIIWFRDGKLSLEKLREYYPGMAAYLENIVTLPGLDPFLKWVDDYFSAYKIAKLRDEYTMEVKATIEEKTHRRRHFGNGIPNSNLPMTCLCLKWRLWTRYTGWTA